MTDPDELERAERDAAAEADPEPGAALEPEIGPEPEAAGPSDSLSSADYSTVFSPRNVAVGLAVVAGLIAIAARRRRRTPRGDA